VDEAKRNLGGNSKSRQLRQLQTSLRRANDTPEINGKGLVGLTFEIGNFSSSSLSSGISKKTKDWILNTGWVIDVQVCTNAIKKSVVGVLLRNFSAKHGSWDGKCHAGLWRRSCHCHAKKGDKDSCCLVLHDVGLV
jgi:hypothetical protein